MKWISFWRARNDLRCNERLQLACERRRKVLIIMFRSVFHFQYCKVLDSTTEQKYIDWDPPAFASEAYV